MPKLYIDEPCVVSFFCGEFGWYLQRFQAFMRHQKQEVYPNHKFILFMNPHLHVFVNDFVSYTIDLPKDFYSYQLEGDGYEAVFPSSPAGSYTPPSVYKNIIKYCRNFYNVEKAVELWPPRGCNMILETHPQLFAKYSGNRLNLNRPIITVFPRHRDRAANRNVPVYVWKKLVDTLKNHFLVVLAGTPKGACLQDYEDPNVINLIKYNELDKTDQVITYLTNSVCSISSQSGGTHISLLCDCPSYVIGHQKQRHTCDENRYKTPTSFRYLADYRAISADVILNDVAGFLQALEQARLQNECSIEDTLMNDKKKLNNMMENK